jgi:hypothetical protein
MSKEFFQQRTGADPLRILETAERVAALSREVRIDRPALTAFVGALTRGFLSRPAWDPRYHFHDGSLKTVFYFLVLDSLNFCFWPAAGETRWEIDYGTARLSGYYGLAAALKQAVEEGKPLLNAGFLASLTGADWNEILGGRGRLQLAEERLAILRETGRVLLEVYGGDPGRLLKAAAGSAAALVRLLAAAFPSFQDTAVYDGQTVYFYKRAQILAADLHGAFGGRHWGAFRDLDQLTAFADYKLPQVLRHLGIFEYGERLALKVDQLELLEPGSPEEVEIRANTVWAVELIRRESAAGGLTVRASEIDWLLWNLGQQDTFRKKAYHRTRTIYN